MSTRAQRTKPRRRRSAEELRRVIVLSAQELFSAKGYAGTTTKEVAFRAEVAEQSVFSHFGSKQGLYDAAILESFDEFIRRYTMQWHNAVDEIDSLDQMMTRYVDGLYDVVVDHRELFRALPVGHLAHVAVGIFDVVEAWVVPLVERHGYRFDPYIAVRAIFMLVTTMALFEDDLAPARDRGEITAELTATLMHGLTRGS